MIMIIENMKMSIKTRITIDIVIVNNVTYIIIIIIMDSAHISLISAGISLSCGKGHTNTTAAHKHDCCFVDNEISVYAI